MNVVFFVIHKIEYVHQKYLHNTCARSKLAACIKNNYCVQVILCLCSSSLFFDEDGDLAHEFYEETIVTRNGRKKAKLKKIQKNLTPQVRKLKF